MSEYELAQLGGLTPTTSAMCHCQIVEHEELSWLERDGDLNIIDGEAMPREECEFGSKAVKFQSAEEPWIDFHTREERRALSSSSLDDASEASLDVAEVIIPGAVRTAVGHQALDQFP